MEVSHCTSGFDAIIGCDVHRLSLLCVVTRDNILYDTCPDYMKENFLRLSNLHCYNTRGSNFNFQELKHTVLGHFIIMPLLIGIDCLMISCQSH